MATQGPYMSAPGAPTCVRNHLMPPDAAFCPTCGSPRASQSITGQQFGQPVGVPPAPSQGTNGFAIASLILGILWIWGLGSILAFIFGMIGLNQTKKNPQQGGRGLAVAGVVLGSIGIVGVILITIAVAVANNNCAHNGTC